MRPDGTDIRQLTSNRDFPDGGFRPPMAWSPDGQTLAFSAFVGEILQIHTRSADGSLRVLSPSDGHAFSPSYSPDGEEIVFVSRREGAGKRPSASRVWVMRADGSGARHLANGAGGDVRFVDWSPTLARD